MLKNGQIAWLAYSKPLPLVSFSHSLSLSRLLFAIQSQLNTLQRHSLCGVEDAEQGVPSYIVCMGEW